MNTGFEIGYRHCVGNLLGACDILSVTFEGYQHRINTLLKGLDFLLTPLKINLNKKKIKMNDLLVKEFNGEPIYNFIWRDKPCWIALDIANAIGYKDKSTTINLMIKRENFKEGKEYSVLSGDELKDFKNVFGEHLKELKYTPKIVIFYEEGLYGFLAASRMDKGVEFRTWIRREVMPQIREKGSYTLEKVKEEKIIVDNNPTVLTVDNNLVGLRGENKRLKKELFELRNSLDFDIDKFQRLKMAYEASKMFKDLLDDITLDSKYKFLFMKKIFNDSGFELPMYIEEELN